MNEDLEPLVQRSMNKWNMIMVWKNKGKILEGIKNSIFKQEHIEDISASRTKLCQTNECGYYDHLGETEKVVLRGHPSCAQCGCKIALKSRSLSSFCSLKDIGKTPMWEAVMTQKEEDYLREKTGIKNDI